MLMPRISSVVHSRFYRSLGNYLKHKRSAVYRPVAEVIGLALAYYKSKGVRTKLVVVSSRTNTYEYEFYLGRCCSSVWIYW